MMLNQDSCKALLSVTPESDMENMDTGIPGMQLEYVLFLAE